MKNKALLIAVFVVFNIVCKAQDSISFKMHFLPLHKYEQTVTQQLKSITTFFASDSVLDVLKKEGISNPTIVNKTIIATSVTTTGDYDDNMKMPVLLIYQNVKDKDGTVLIPKGAGLMGTVKKNEMPQFDSIIIPAGSNDRLKTALNQVKNIFQQVQLPRTKMKVGDEYVHETPLTIPLPGMTLKAVVSVIYKLTGITDSVANFDLVMKAKFDTENASLQKGEGDGSGTLVYDRINEFPIKEILDYTMQMNVGTGEKSIKVEIDSNSSHNYVISNL